ncbi:hypothetical protein I3I95_05525 [bacterium]|nr:hypothetical protein [bacterium]
MSDGNSSLTDEEREELERLRAQKAAAEQRQRDEQDRRELERLRKQQRLAQEDAAYYAERQRRKEERQREREHPDYSLDDLEPMPRVQKIVIGVLAVAFVVLIAYLIWFNVLR